ncbi:2-dehydro-3-deoxygalactonokinase [Roseivivax marinus]|jgi:2-dehydro-3-deoxygalactonokinase|uniref:2-dehydro-3-deoxygalactonokinase n=1 Tax=Roseivivax marinus TaxID=1379903 RepID=W4HRM6_9RHOB|nr:2-dehydro-3-deoxygalactonokinase [Roseivivax marinus]ETW14675.1 2-dehydro-3-deoxygalactonokinase [Roseivivax marinus]UMA66092.1 2-dehydro-3-deoxygalactonokinase [Roseivivax marinus]SEL05223.1 2-dehydro-3-deoxygalactonokinase [Roseivivax marinus]
MDWIAADWGTTHLQLWEMEADGTVLNTMLSDQGMGVLLPEDYEPTLLGLLRNRLPTDRTTPVIACGMVGARQGWIEAPYAPVPAAPPSAAIAVRPKLRDPRLAVHVLPGMSQASPADVMRGEEVRISGVLAEEPDFDGIVCLPGLHTIWAQISAGEVVSFRTFMTAELVKLLSTQSVLRLSVGQEGWDEAEFQAGLDRGLSTPAALASDAFRLRAEALLDDLPSEAARARLWGLLIGVELAAAKPYWLGQAVRIVGVEDPVKLYSAALAKQGVQATSRDWEAMTLAGLGAARRTLLERA